MTTPARPAPLSASEEAWQPPAEFDEYRIVRRLGRGRMGHVFLAHDTLLDRPVAVKFVLAPDASTLARFLNEARAAARLQHPNVVTLYRVGQLDERAYLVSEYTRGLTLDRLKKPMPWDQALRLARELTRGLAAAHRRGVLHRDIKPANAILTESGQVKLLDFGLAKLLESAPGSALSPEALSLAQALTLGRPAVDSLGGERPQLSGGGGGLSGELVGTPYYMSPEAWRGEEHTARSDLYSLGALVYELCVGHAPFRHVPLAELPGAVQEREAPALLPLAPEVDPALAAVVETCLRRNPAERFASAEALLDALAAVGPATETLQVPEGNPYRGLQPFGAEHRAFFFGRARDLRAVIERLRAESFLLLTGDSGVGKSSLCAAGVLPALREGALQEGRKWDVRRLVPGRRPLSALALALAPALGSSTELLTAELASEPGQLARRLRSMLGADAGLVLYIDQMEELVTLSEPEDARRLAESLAPLAEGIAGVRLIGSARSDFLTRLCGLPGLGGLISRALYLVPPLGPEEVREAVVGPARVKGARFESEALVSTLVASTAAADGGLPLLQFALAQLWEMRDVSRGIIPASALDLLDGVSGALARHADGVVDALAPEERRAARALLVRLVTDEGTRARRGAEELAGDDPRYHAALEALVRGRLLVARESSDGSTFEVAHEALLTGWATLARWLAEEHETRPVRQRLEAAAREWERTGGAGDVLWGARALEEARLLDLDALPARERRFLTASRTGLRRVQRRRRALAVGFVLALLAVGGAARLRVVLENERAAARELATARELLAQATVHQEEEERARREAFAAFDQGQVPRGEETWMRAREQGVAVAARQAQATEALERALVLSPNHAEIRDTLSDTLLARARRAERDGQPALRDVLSQRLTLVDLEGARARQWNAPATLEVERPPEGVLRLERYRASPEGRHVLEPVPLAASGATFTLEPGSYLLTLSTPSATEVKLPVVLGRGESRRVNLTPPPLTPPPGFIYVPEGRFLFGSAADESVRLFFSAAPLHEVHTPAYFIARTETTWADWLEYLEALPPEEFTQRLPRTASTGFHGALQLRREAGKWVLGLRPTSQLLVAREGEPLRYPGRTHRAEVDWKRLPVVGITYEDAREYAAWLDRTGRVPGARLCTEVEWERAARGADGREFPHGDRMLPDDANFDLTYGKQPLGFGPDEVGSHPASASPFGVMDLAGNVWEWTDSVLTPGKPVARGGSYYFAANTCRSINRESPEPGFRDLTVGTRLCVSAPPAPVQQ